MDSWLNAFHKIHSDVPSPPPEVGGVGRGGGDVGGEEDIRIRTHTPRPSVVFFSWGGLGWGGVGDERQDELGDK